MAVVVNITSPIRTIHPSSITPTKTTMDLRPSIGNRFRTGVYRPTSTIVKITRCTSRTVAAMVAGHQEVATITSNTREALRPTIKPIISSVGDRRPRDAVRPQASTRARAITISSNSSRTPTCSTANTGQVSTIQATSSRMTLEIIIGSRISSSNLVHNNTTTRPRTITTRITTMVALRVCRHSSSHHNSSRIAVLVAAAIRRGVRLMWRSRMRT